MALSTALRPTSASFPPQQSESFSLWFSGEQKRIVIKVPKRKSHPSWNIKSVLDNRNSSINDNETTEPVRILLERWFAQTQKLEEQIGRDSDLPEDAQLGLNLEMLESDLQAVLAALKKKEEDLQDAERKVVLEQAVVNRAKEELACREEVIAAAYSDHEKLEEELKQAKLSLASHATQIDYLKHRLKERDEKISDAQSALAVKEDEMNKMKNELVKKSKEAASTEYELKFKVHLLDEVNEIVNKQEVEVQQLRKAIQEKEEELEVSVTLRKCQEEKAKVAEANLKQQTMEWLLAQEELKKLAEETSMDTAEVNETLDDFRRVKKILNDVRSELVSSQKALASAKQKMEDQEHLLEKQLLELEELKKSVMSYMISLKDAEIEVESERTKLKVAEARNMELEQDLSRAKEIVKQLQEELDKVISSVKQAIQEKSFLQEELDRENTKFEGTLKLLQVKESELVEARLEIQRLKSEQASLQLVLGEKDSELINARKKLEEVIQEMAELRALMNSREDQLIQATSMMEEKEEHLQTMQNELNSTKLKFSEAETVVERILELTNKLIISVKDEDYEGLTLYDDMENKSHPSFKYSTNNFKWHTIQLETELEFTRENLRTKEMEIIAAKRALTIKDEELEMVLGRLDARERELKEMKEEMIQDATDLKQLYALAQERIGEKSIGDLAIEKLQLEAAQLEVQAATSALHKLAEMSREFLGKAGLCVEGDSDRNGEIVVNSEFLAEFKTEVARLSVLTDQLVKEAGIVGDMNY